MLTKCPECELQVSDKAVICPHCGYPFDKSKISYRRSNKRKRLPNGFGQISEIKNKNLRKPFRVMVTIGKSETGKPICKPLKPVTYFKTYNEAYEALIEFHKNPYILSERITVKELYDRWSEQKYKSLSFGAVRHLKGAWDYCSDLYDIPVQDLKIHHLRQCLAEGTKTTKTGKILKARPVTQQYIKNMFNQMLDYAVEYEIVNRNIARDFKLPKDIRDELAIKNGHIPFTDEEMETMWKYEGDPTIDKLLIQCYSGWRPGELFSLEMGKISLDEWSFIGGLKTEAGKDRKVPIHPRIRNIVTKYYNQAIEENREYLFGVGNRDVDYTKYCMDFVEIREKIGLGANHRLHDGRTHFVTSAKKAGVDEYAIKYMVGHRIEDITEAVYTKRSFEWLMSEIEKIQ